jgi:predicted extracellular nuclease
MIRRKMLTALVIVAILFTSLPTSFQPAQALSTGVVISQVYGGGGNTGATYTHDFIELFNLGSTPASLAGWSLQYASATGTGNFGSTTAQITELPAITLAPGQYFLVQEAQGTGGTTPLPTPDATDATPIAMSATGAKVALVNTTTPLGCNGGSTPCTPEQIAMIVDLVGWDGANFFEGAPAPATTNTTSISRNAGGCAETDNNSADFVPGAPNPRNSSSPLNSCAVDPVINEFVANHVGTDTNEYIEVFGEPSIDYSAFTLLEIEGDTTGSGVVDGVWPVGATDGAGLWWTGYINNDIENGSVSLFLVESFTGAIGDDLDTNNDGSLDATPWTRLVDSVAVNDGGVGDFLYGSTVLDSSFDGLGFVPGGASRIPDGFDSDAVTDWVRNDFDLAGIPGFPGTPVIGEAYNTPLAPNAVVVPPPEACGDPFTFIYDVQGSSDTSPVVGTEVAVEGVVVGDFQNNAGVDNGNLNGFHVQDPSGDGNPATSDGIFIFAPTITDDVMIGDHVRVRGAVSEFNGMTEITAARVWLCSSANAILPTPISLPVTSVSDFEAFEGMLVTFPQQLYIAEYFNFDRFNEIVLTSERHQTPTAEFEPGPDAIAAAQEFLLDRITLDDGRSAQNPDPAIHPNGGIFDLDNLFRGGDLVQNVTGVLDYSFNLYRVHPVQGADYIPANPRSQQPDEVGGYLKVSSFNVLNYFTTIDTGAFICGPLQNQECRGADTPEELARQRAKIIAALSGINADVFGLIEIENHPGDVPTADLVSGLNDVFGAGTYDYIATGAIGSDAIRQALIYKPASVTPLGAYAVLDSSVDPRFLDDYNRPTPAQSFQDNATGEVFTVAVNHLKSKGSDCNDIGDPDTGDGSGNCNLTRKAAAEALVDWLASDPTGSGDPDSLIIGDLNSYDKEDPIDVLLAGGYTDLVYQYLGEDAYSYVFDGQTGYLDHGLASSSLLGHISGATIWHINADEPDLIDYDMTFKQDVQDAIFAPDAYRSSDHDPVIVGICEATPPQVEIQLSQTVLWPPDHKYRRVNATVQASDNADPAPVITLVSVTSDEPDDGEDDGNTVNDIVILNEYSFRLRAERSGLGDGRVYTITYQVTDACGNVTLAEAFVTVPLEIDG